MTEYHDQQNGPESPQARLYFSLRLGPRPAPDQPIELLLL
jgi:hypothetical protein